MTKNFVLDTNVLLHDAGALHAFGDNDVVVPIYCIEEIDTFKKDLSELGRNARAVSREIDSYRKKGSLSDGVLMETGGKLRVLFAKDTLPNEVLTFDKKDDLILAVAWDVMKTEPGKETIFVTMDTNLRIRANAIKMDAQDYERDYVRVDKSYTGFCTAEVESRLIDALYQEGSLPKPAGMEAVANEFVTLKALDNPSQQALAKVSSDGASLKALKKLDRAVWGIQPRNREQRFALDLLLDDSIPLVTLVGKAGTGKTLLAIAAGLTKVTEEEAYSKLLVSRPIFPLGRDIGYLPGTMEDKLNPWMQPVYDSVDFLLALTRKDRKGAASRGFKELQDLGFMQIEPLTYIRGRSIPKQYLVVDEAQNLTRHEVKTILTRAGEGTKVVLTGDPEQIDQPYLDSRSNGLSYTVERMKGDNLAGHVTLTKGERSALAEKAADKL